MNGNESRTPVAGLRRSMLSFGEAPRLPRLHLPYLCVVAIWSLLTLVAVLVELPLKGPGPERLRVLFAVNVVIWVLHVLWLARLFSDGERCGLGVRLWTPLLVALASALASLVWLTPLWTVFALASLARLAHGRVLELAPGRGRALRALLDELPGLLLASGALTVISLVAYWRVDQAPAHHTAVQVLGRGPAVLVAIAYLAAMGWCLRWTVRTVPALYRAYRVVRHSRELRGGEGL